MGADEHNEDDAEDTEAASEHTAERLEASASTSTPRLAPLERVDDVILTVRCVAVLFYNSFHHDRYHVSSLPRRLYTPYKH